MADRDDNTEPQLPAELAGEMKRLFTHRAFVPGEMDEAVLAAGRARLGRLRRRRMARRFAAGFAAAAVVGIVVYVQFSPDSTGTQPDVFAREDVNRDGRVNIVDALMLARRVEAHDADLDINGDGSVDRGDVDALAMMAVALPVSTSEAKRGRESFSEMTPDPFFYAEVLEGVLNGCKRDRTGPRPAVAALQGELPGAGGNG